MPNKGNNAFIPKLTSMIETHPHLINWAKQGTQVEIRDVRRFREELHPIYFPKSNYPSFMRQLSMYGFTKMTTRRNTLTLRHYRFRKGNQNIFNTITRKMKTHPNSDKRVGSILSLPSDKRCVVVKEEPQKTPSFQQVTSTEETLLPGSLPPIPEVEIHNTILTLSQECTEKGREILIKLAQLIQQKIQENKEALRQQQKGLPSIVSFGRIPEQALEAQIQSIIPLQASLSYLCEQGHHFEQGLFM